MKEKKWYEVNAKGENIAFYWNIDYDDVYLYTEWELQEDYIGEAKNFKEFKIVCDNFIEHFNKSKHTLNQMVDYSDKTGINILDVAKKFSKG